MQFSIPVKNSLLSTICYIAILLFAVLLNNCRIAPEKIGDLDLTQWRSDRGACDSKRPAQVAAFKKAEEQLLSSHINKIDMWLGRPDIHQLGGRDQKYYVYFLEKGTHCDDIKKPSNAQKVILRFNSVGLLAEITYQTEPL